VWQVLGLGNPGSEYADTRHNLGFRVVDALASRASVRLRRGDGDFDAATATIAATAVRLVKPRTYVNRSGGVVTTMAQRADFDLASMLVVLDDVYLPFGRLRLRPSGRAGGHNGMKSILDALGGATAFPRLRLGVGLPPADIPLEDWVLAEFEGEEKRAVPDLVARAADAVEQIVSQGIDRALPGINAPTT
jgi:PTH1 family peptidyl-tRNA hydrolase